MPAPAPALSRRIGFLPAFAAPFRALGTLARTPRLWPLAAVPSLLFVALVAALAGLGYEFFPRLLAWLLAHLGGDSLGEAGAVTARILLFVLLSFVAVLVPLVLVPPLAAPFMDALASRVDLCPECDEPRARQIARSLRVALTGLLLVTVPQLVLFVLSLAIPVLAPLWIPLGAALGAFGLAYDVLDWPLSRRGMDARARLAFMRANPGLTRGLGLAVWVLFWVPGLSIVLLPAAVVGAVSLVNEAEGSRGTVAQGAR